MVFTFGEQLRSLRQRASLKQTDLAAALGIHPNTLSLWERGHYMPNDRELLLPLEQELALSGAEIDKLLRAAGFAPKYDTSHPLAQLRPPVADFVGRADELAHLRTTLQAAVTDRSDAVIGGVLGMGGVGKTELAYAVAYDLRDAFCDAQLVLPMRGTSAAPLAPEQALQAVIRAFRPDAKLPGDQDELQAHYQAVLHGKRALILADDARDAAQVRALVPPVGCALLITSRQRFTLPGMVTVDLEHLSTAEAVALLRRICLRLQQREAQAIAEACGYLPLALRISAGILHNDPSLLVADYIQQLADERQRLSQLRDPDDPHLDVVASLALSYTQLEGGSQQVFRQLGVLVADFATPLAQAVVELPIQADVEGVLRLLLRRNLLMYDAGRARWRLHDLVRALARQELETAGELDATALRYVRYTVQIVQETKAQFLAGGDGVLAALARFDAERPHIDAARRWLAAHAGTPASDSLLVADALATYDIGELRYDGRRERIPQLERALAAAQRLGDRPGEGQLLNSLGRVCFLLGEARRATPYLERALAIARALGDQHGEGNALNNLGASAYRLGDVQRAISAYEQAIAIARATGDRRREGHSLNNLGACYVFLGEIRRALSAYEQVLVIARETHDRNAESHALGNLGFVYCSLGEARPAIAADEQAIVIARAAGDRWVEGHALSNLGDAYCDLGDSQQAITYLEDALAIARAIGDRHNEGETLGRLGRAHIDSGMAQRAIELCTAALAIMREIGDQREEGHILSILARAYGATGALAPAATTFEQARAILRAAGDRNGEAQCNWHYGLFFARQGEREPALELLRAAVAYEQEIGHAKAAEHASLLAEIEGGRAFQV